MLKMSMYMFYAAFGSTIIAFLLYLTYLTVGRGTRVMGVATSAGQAGRQVVRTAGPSRSTGMSASLFSVIAFAFLTLSLLFRTIATGNGPFTNMFEFAVSFAWGIMLAYVYIEYRYRTRALGAVVVPWAAAILAYAAFLTAADVQPLVPALQNSLLLTIHVAVAIIAYGTFAVAFGAAVLYLWQENYATGSLPSARLMDEIGYRSVVIGFPMMALVIILGALWADVAWGSYWSWDPKETASLVTWLIYGGYLHARVMRGWRGKRSAILLLIGFVATLFTFFGNYFFGGLHSYT